MKKSLIFLALIIIIVINFNKSEIIIPNTAIRFRIIANSNSLEDQVIKANLEKTFESKLFEITKNLNNPQDVKLSLIKDIDKLNDFVESYFEEQKIKSNFKISIGNNYFPQKHYRGIKYEAGYYDSVVLTIGQGQGLNWWCVIYPPLCLIDEKDSKDIEYTTIVQEILNKYQM